VTAVRWLSVGEAHLRELSRRRVALALLVAVPLAFYASVAGHNGPDAIRSGIVGMAFSIAGAAIFVVLGGRAVDERLLLAGYRRSDLLAGRLACVAVVAAPVSVITAAVMVSVSHPPRTGWTIVAVAALAVVAAPVGLLIGTVVARDLEAVLVLMGLVGVQLSLDVDQLPSKLLPFYGPRRLIEVALGQQFSATTALAATAGYSLAAIALAAAVARKRLRQPPAVPTASRRLSAGQSARAAMSATNLGD
jgi:hypothetical protein